MSSPLRVVDYLWHQVHGYRLHALDATFTYALYRQRLWNLAQRPMPLNFDGAIEPGEIRPEDFDLSILHADQWCDTYNLRAFVLRQAVRATAGIPQVLIMHGTPDNEKNRLAVLRLIGDVPVVCNSEQAAFEWDAGEAREDRLGLPQFRFIHHGYDHDEFFSYPLAQREMNVVTVCGGGTLSREYHGIPLIERLQRDIPTEWYGTRGTHPFMSSYYLYRHMLASSLIYFSPTRRAPMPGARTEAMLAGCCVVSVPGNDWENIVAHGISGFIVETYEQARDLLARLLARPEIAWGVGQQGRVFAQGMFGKMHFVHSWENVLAQVLQAGRA